MRYRDRNAKGENDHRSRRVEQAGVLTPWLNALDRSRAVLLICGRRSWEEGARDVFRGNVHTCGGLGVPHRRVLRCLLALLSFSESRWGFRTRVRTGRRFPGNFVVLNNGGLYEDRRAYLVTVVRYSGRKRRNRRYFPASRIALRRAIRLPSTSRVFSCLLCRPFLHSNRFGEGVL